MMTISRTNSQVNGSKNYHKEPGMNDLLSLAIQESGTGVWDRNVVTGEIYYSPGWKRLLGYDVEDINNHISDSVDRVHPDDRPYVLAAMQAHFEFITPGYSVEHRLRCKDGSYRWVRSQGRVVSRDSNGQALRMVGTTIDITKTRELTTKLHDAAELIRLLTDEIPGMVYQCQRVSDGYLSFTYISAGSREIYEIEPEDAIRDSRLIFSRIHPDDVTHVLASINRSEATLSSFQYEHRVVLPKKGVRWLLVMAKPKVREDEGTVVWYGIVTDVTDRKQNEIVLNEYATTDSLTQLSNRRHFLANFEHEILESVRRKRSIAVLMCDLDHFKQINDTYGHPVGDKVLQSLAELLRKHLRKDDLVGRVGGEEFALVLSGVTAEDAVSFANRLRQDLAVHRVVASMPELIVTISIGIAIVELGKESVDAALARSDQALYQAKNSGRNQVVLAKNAG